MSKNYWQKWQNCNWNTCCVMCTNQENRNKKTTERMWSVSIRGTQNHSLITSIVTYCQLVTSMASQIVTYKIVFAFCWNAFQWINKLASGVETHSTVLCILHLTILDFHQLVKILGVYKSAIFLLTWKTNSRPVPHWTEHNLTILVDYHGTVIVILIT